MIKQKFHPLVRESFVVLDRRKARVDEVTYDLRLSKDELEQLNDAEDALRTSLHAHEKMRELQFSGDWARVGMAADEVAWAMEMNKLKADIETYVCACIDIVAKGARSFGALEPFRKCLADRAEDIKRRAFVLIDQRDLPRLDSHISKVASDRVTQWQNWAERELKPAWMAQPEALRGDDMRNSQLGTTVKAGDLQHEISAGAENGSTQPLRRPPSQFEIEQYANEIFRAGLEDRIDGYAKKQAQALQVAGSTNNIGARLPALIQCKRERLRAEILILADAWVQAATTYNVPLGKWADKALEKAAVRMAGGVRSAFQGEIELHAARTRTSTSEKGGGREIERAMKSALGEARLRLKTQRIKVESALRGFPPSGPQSGTGPVKNYKTALARNIDKLRKECGWSFEDLAEATDLDKKLVHGHVSGGKGAHPKTLERYAQTFTEKLGRPVTVAELES